MLLQGTQSSTEHHPLGYCCQKASGVPKPLSQNILHISHYFIPEKANKIWSIAALGQWVELNRDALMTSQCCHRNSRSSFFSNKVISELSFTGVNLLCLGHEIVSLKTVGNDKTRHLDLLGTRGSERPQRDIGRGHRSSVNFPVGLCCARAPFQAGDGSRGALLVLCRSALQAAACIPWCWCWNPSFPKSHSPAERRPLSPRGASKAFLRQ